MLAPKEVHDMTKQTINYKIHNIQGPHFNDYDKMVEKDLAHKFNSELRFL